jgi:hypothetical protein
MDQEDMDAPAEQQAPLKPKRKYKPRAICTDPDLKYRYKPKPGPKPGRGKRKRYKPERTDAEQRLFSRNSARSKKAAKNVVVPASAADHLVHILRTEPSRVSRYGIPDGMNRAQATVAWAKARAQAEKVFTTMVDQGIIADVAPEDFERVIVQTEGKEHEVLVPKTDEAKASVALKEAMVMALGPMGTQQTKLAAINTVLKFTKSPPAQKLEVSKAEDLLAAALADMKQEDGDK